MSSSEGKILKKKSVTLTSEDPCMTSGSLLCVLHNKHAQAPTRKLDSNGYDMYSAESVVIPPGEQKIIDTGVSIQMPMMPEPFAPVGVLKDRSSLSAKHILRCGAGVIDMDYTGIIKVVLMNHSIIPYKVNIGDRICQLLIIATVLPKVKVVQRTRKTDRGTDGFGSTGI